MCKIFATRGPQHQNKMKKLIVIKQSQCSNFKELSSCRFLCHGEGDWTLAILKFQIPRCSLDIALQSHYMACIHVHTASLTNIMCSKSPKSNYKTNLFLLFCVYSQ